MRVRSNLRSRTSFSHPKTVRQQDAQTFGILPIRVVVTHKKTEYGFEADVREIKQKEQAELEANYPRPRHLPLPSYDLGGQTRLVEIAEPKTLLLEDEEDAEYSAVA
jgi:hypothetical protein